MRLSVNGKFVQRITLRGTEPSFNYGYGVFETLRTYRGKPFAVAAHLRRLRLSAQAIRLVVTVTDAEFVRWLQPHCSSVSDVRIKMMAVPDAIYITSLPLTIDEQIYQHGVSLGTSRVERLLPYAKTIARLPEYLAHEEATQQGHYDALLMNAEGGVLEGAYSNIFIVKKNVIITPKQGILSGITREIVMQLAKRRLRIKEQQLWLRDLGRAEECFITQTSTGIVPVVQIDHKRIGDGRPGPLTQQLHQLFLTYVQRATR